MSMSSDMDGLTTNPILHKEFVMEMISVTTVFTSSVIIASSRYQTLNLDLTDQAVSSTARSNSNGPSGSPCWMLVGC